MLWEDKFKGKKITVMGLGLLGRAVGDARFLAEMGAELVVTDLKDERKLAPSLEILKPYPGITYRLGAHDLADFQGRDYIFKAAGVPLESIYIAEAKKHRIPIKMSASWFAELAQIPIVGVTGTRGKTTTTMMLDSIMRAGGMEVLVGGNVKGVSTLALLPQVTSESIALMELDSWQCAGFGDAGMSPNVAVFTTFFDDHLNYYKNDRDAYLNEKAQIFLYQKPEDTLVISTQVVPYMGLFKSRVASRVMIAKQGKLKLNVLGEHNQLNAACALEAARALGIGDDISLKALENFKGVPGRLELIREVNSVKIYNDTTATTPEATLAALDALRNDSGQNQNLILILGGADKGLDMSALVARLSKLKKVVFLAGSGTDRLKTLAQTAMIYHSTLAEALQEAMVSAEPGDIVLFSPSFASFGMFKNEYDRGDQFNALVKAL